MTFDRRKKRAVELQLIIHDPAKGEGTSIDDARVRNRAACDGVFVVQAVRDAKASHYVTSSYDSDTGDEFTPAEMFNVWVSLAGHVAKMTPDGADATREDQRNRRFVIAVLTQLKMSEKLGRLEENQKVQIPPGVSSPALESLEEAVSGEADHALVDGAVAAGAEVAEARRMSAMQLIDMFASGELVPIDDDMKTRE